jgi:hypothetical protein
MKERPAICLQGVISLLVFLLIADLGFLALRIFMIPFFAVAGLLWLKGIFVVDP